MNLHSHCSIGFALDIRGGLGWGFKLKEEHILDLCLVVYLLAEEPGEIGKRPREMSRVEGIGTNNNKNALHTIHAATSVIALAEARVSAPYNFQATKSFMLVLYCLLIMKRSVWKTRVSDHNQKYQGQRCSLNCLPLPLAEDLLHRQT